MPRVVWHAAHVQRLDYCATRHHNVFSSKLKELVKRWESLEERLLNSGFQMGKKQLCCDQLIPGFGSPFSQP
jgi:hypothetical protein